MTPSLDRLTSGKSGTGSAAAAISAAIFGPAFAPSADQPAVSRTFTKVSGAGSFEFRGDFGEQRRFLRAADDQRLAVRRGGAELLDLGAAEMMRGRDRRRGSRAAPLSASSGIVSSHEQIRICGRSAICVWHLVGDYL